VSLVSSANDIVFSGGAQPRPLQNAALGGAHLECPDAADRAAALAGELAVGPPRERPPHLGQYFVSVVRRSLSNVIALTAARSAVGAKRRTDQPLRRRFVRSPELCTRQILLDDLLRDLEVDD
jgi:hypothetical protein